jgi:hypothetical protein
MDKLTGTLERITYYEMPHSGATPKTVVTAGRSILTKRVSTRPTGEKQRPVNRAFCLHCAV